LSTPDGVVTESFSMICQPWSNNGKISQASVRIRAWYVLNMQPSLLPLNSHAKIHTHWWQNHNAMINWGLNKEASSTCLFTPQSGRSSAAAVTNSFPYLAENSECNCNNSGKSAHRGAANIKLVMGSFKSIGHSLARETCQQQTQSPSTHDIKWTTDFREGFSHLFSANGNKEKISLFRNVCTCFCTNTYITILQPSTTGANNQCWGLLSCKASSQDLLLHSLSIFCNVELDE
jgi:hypothetical protein